jgi:hypothetical protein
MREGEGRRSRREPGPRYRSGVPVRSALASLVVAFFLSLAPIARAGKADPPDDGQGEAPESETEGSGVVSSIAAGGALQTLLDIPVVGAEGIGTLGGRAAEVEGTLLLGRTQYGLECLHGTLGVALGDRAGAWGFGITPYLGYLSISRVTTSGSLQGGTLGVSVHLSWDFARWPRSAFFVLARATGEVIALTAAGVGLSVGYRFGP